MVIFKYTLNSNKYFFRQIALANTAFTRGISAGGIFGFSSILFSQLKSDDHFRLDENMESWFASITTLVMFLMCLIAGIAMEWVGRKKIITLSEILIFTGWILTYFAHNYTMLIIARIILGISAGISYPAFIAFIGEISAPQYRAILLTAPPVGTSIGTFICQLLGDYIHWNIVAAIFSCLSIINMIFICYIKESYVTNLDQNKIEEARTAYKWYRGHEDSSQREFEEVLEVKNTKSKNSVYDMIQMCSTKEFLIPLGITTLVFLTNEFSATQAVMFYTSDIVKMIKDDSKFESMATLILNILRVISVVASMFLVKATSLRFILISSGYMLGVSLFGTGLFMYLSTTYSDYSIFPILTLCTIVLNAVLYSVGLGPLPSVVCGEMFPQATRSIGGAISAAASFLFLFIVVKCMPMMFASVGSYWSFTIFGVCTLLGISLSHFVLPHTKNKTLQEVNRVYQSKL